MLLKPGRVLVCFIAFYLVFIHGVTNAYAHKMIVESVGPGVVQVKYEDGKIPHDATVTLFDENGEQILTGSIDEEGYFKFDPELGPKSITATDPLGHLAEWTGDNKAEKGGVSMTVAGGVVALLVIISALFYFRNTKKQNST